MLWIGVAALTLFVILVPWIAYWRGLRLIPDGRLETSIVPVSDQASELTWRSLDGLGEPRLIVKNPYQLATQVWLRSREPNRPRPEQQLASLAAHYLLGDAPTLHGWRRRMALTSAQIWIARHRSAEEAIALILARSKYGRSRVGIDAAARLYFGRDAASLEEPELAMLVVLRLTPDQLDPWCDPNRVESAVVGQFPHLSDASRIISSTLLDPFEGACEQE